MDSVAMSLDEIIKKKKIPKGGFRNGKPAVKPVGKPKKTPYVQQMLHFKPICLARIFPPPNE